MKTINFYDSYLDGIETGWRFGSEDAENGLKYSNEEPKENANAFYRGFYEGYDGGYHSIKDNWYKDIYD